MRKHTNLFRKSAGVILSTSLAAAAFASPVSAAASYSELCDSLLKDSVSSMAEIWQQELDDYNAMSGNSTEEGSESSDIQVNYEISIDDFLLSMIPEDYSAIRDLFPLTIVQKQVVGETPLYIQMTAQSASGIELTLNYLLDTENQVIYMQIPELSSASVMMNYSAEVTTSENLSEALSDYMNDPSSVLPTGAELENLLYNYPSILLKHIGDAGTESTTMEASGVSQEVTAYHGTISNSDVTAALEEILDYAEADEDLKNVLDKLSILTEEEDDLYAELIESLPEMREELSYSEDEEDLTLLSTIYEDAEGNIIGFDVTDDAESASIQFYTTENNGETGLDIRMTENYDGEIYTYFSISGSGTLNGDALTGDYTLSADETDIVNVHVENANKDTGKISVSLSEDVMSEDAEDDLVLSLAAAANIGFAYDTTSESAPQVLSLGIADADYATIAISCETIEGLVPMTIADFGTIYDSTNEEEMELYMNDVYTNLPNVIPEEILNLIAGSAE